MPTLVTQKEFAAHRGVSGARVSQWISAGDIHGEALQPDPETGRRKVALEIADAQLAAKLQPGGLLGKELRAGQQQAPAPAPAAALEAATPGHAERFAAARAEKAAIEARQAARAERAETGVYMLTDDARAEMARIASGWVTAVDIWLPEVASRIAAETAADQRRILSVLRTEWRRLRERQAKDAAGRRDSVPETAEEPAPEHEGESRTDVDPAPLGVVA